MIYLAVGRGPSPRSVLQGQCKPNAESLLFAEVQPVLAMSIAKLGTKKSSQIVWNDLGRIWETYSL